MSNTLNPARYHGLLRALHWLLAVLILMQLVVGKFVLESLPNDAGKIIPLQGHVTVGLLVGGLMVLRLVTRLVTRKPRPATAGNAVLNGLRRATHFLFYVVVLSMVSTGVGIALMAKLFPVLFGPGGALPESFEAFEPLKGHQFFASALIVLIVIHIAGAAYHQFVLKDRLISRMGFGKNRKHEGL